MENNNLDILKSINLSEYQGVLLDVDDTLYDYKNTHKIAIKKVFTENASGLERMGFVSCEQFISEYTAARSLVKKMHPSNGLTRSRYLAFIELFKSREKSLPIYELALDFEEMYWSFFIDSILNVDSRWTDFLTDCASSKVKVCIVSDMQTRFQVQKLKKLKLASYIPLMVTSEDANHEKPDAHIFSLAINLLNLSPERIIMLGDNFEKDIRGAQALGCQALRVGYNLD